MKFDNAFRRTGILLPPELFPVGEIVASSCSLQEFPICSEPQNVCTVQIHILLLFELDETRQVSLCLSRRVRILEVELMKEE